MTPHQALLRHILAEPHDENARLIFADWLEEQGDQARAAFIRTQCRLEHLAPVDASYSPLVAQERQLYVSNHPRWKGQLPRSRFRRGFLESLSCGDPDWLVSRADEIFDKHPLQHLALLLFEEPKRPGMLGCLPQLGRLATVRLDVASDGAAELLRLTASPHLASLRGLRLTGMELSSSCVRDLLTPQRLLRMESLTTLDLSSSNLNTGFLIALLSSSTGRRITHLDLAYNPQLDTEAIRFLLTSPVWERIEELNLSGLPRLSAEIYSEIGARLQDSSIRRLALGGFPDIPAEITTAFLEELTSRPWGRLEALSLAEMPLSGEPFRQLLGCSQLAQLKRLDLPRTRLTTADIVHLAECPYLRNLTHLNLQGLTFGDPGLLAMAESSSFPQLGYLDLNQCVNVTGVGIGSYLQSPKAAHLRVVKLKGCGDDQVLDQVSRSPSLQRLHSLAFSSRPSGAITERGIAALVESQALPCLSYLDLDDSLTPHGQQILLQATHLAWPGLLERQLATPELKRQHRQRFAGWQGEDLDHDEPFFTPLSG